MKRKIVGEIDTISNKNYFFKINSKRSGPIILGIVFSALNPFFLIWWSTVGLKLITDSIFLFGVVLGILFTFFFHIWMDYVWLTVTSYMISKGILILKAKFYTVLHLVRNYCTCFIWIISSNGKYRTNHISIIDVNFLFYTIEDLFGTLARFHYNVI